MRKYPPIEAYTSLYQKMDFERLGLFRLIAETYHSKEVLYPGSSIHITPSFVFPHVVYVDKSTQAQDFFAAHAEVLDFVTHNREYKRKPFLQFFRQDYSTPLPLPEQSFDLLLSFFAGPIAAACAKYLRTGGLLLTNHPAEGSTGFKQIAMVHFQRGMYKFVSEADIPKKAAKRESLRQTQRGLEYIESEIYFLFKKQS